MAELTPGAPTILVVFGATGDLMERKIVPALFHLRSHGRLPELFRVVGFARRDIPDDAFRERVRAIVRARHAGGIDEAGLDEFASAFSYSRGQFGEAEGYAGLRASLEAIDRGWDTCANKLFYIAAPPENYRVIFESLSASGLARSCGGDGGWTRVLVEKPFGRDAATAQDLDRLLGSLFEESQIYRIDHYLAKEMLQGILSFRFSNNLLEPSWGAQAIERIEIDLLETLDVEGRGAFYDGVGALRDVGQNHLLQMLALLTMPQPTADDADAIRAARVTALSGLVPMTREQVASQTFRAQYDSYRATEGVAPDSRTETFFRVLTELDSDRWRGVPVILTAGKGLAGVSKQITAAFRHPAPCLCPVGHHIENRVVFRLEPAESISISFFTKKPGLGFSLEERDFNFFLYEKEEKAQYVEEYAKLLDDAIGGDQTLFVSTREVAEMWEFIDPIEQEWAEGDVPLRSYAFGTDSVVAEAESVVSMAHAAGALPREIGVVGLGRMGAGIARNLLDHGWRVVGHNRSREKVDALVPDGLVPAYSLEELVSRLKPPRVVWLMVLAGSTVDRFLFDDGALVALLEPGDVVIDGGNSRYTEAAPRVARLAEKGITFIDVGTSGGPRGARLGACLMVGGEREAYERLRPLWSDLSVEGGFRHFPGVGAGHFVKMVHNGIEYGMMQAIAEGFTILRASGYSLDLTDVADVYGHGSVIESRLVGWLESAFRLHGPDLDDVTGRVGATGEGEWTVETAKRSGVDARVIEAAVEFRRMSESDPSWTGQVLSALREQFGGHGIT